MSCVLNAAAGDLNSPGFSNNCRVNAGKVKVVDIYAYVVRLSHIIPNVLFLKEK